MEKAIKGGGRRRSLKRDVNVNARRFLGDVGKKGRTDSLLRMIQRGESWVSTLMSKLKKNASGRGRGRPYSWGAIFVWGSWVICARVGQFMNLLEEN